MSALELRLGLFADCKAWTWISSQSYLSWYINLTIHGLLFTLGCCFLYTWLLTWTKQNTTKCGKWNWSLVERRWSRLTLPFHNIKHYADTRGCCWFFVCEVVVYDWLLVNLYSLQVHTNFDSQHIPKVSDKSGIKGTLHGQILFVLV